MLKIYKCKYTSILFVAALVYFCLFFVKPTSAHEGHVWACIFSLAKFARLSAVAGVLPCSTAISLVS